jgi:enoyl-CoA hydratase
MAPFARELELETLRLEQDGRVLTVRFDDPPYNFITARMQRDLDRLTSAVDEDASIGAVVLTGAPPQRYITHFDIAELLEAAEKAGLSVPESLAQAGLRGLGLARRLPGAEDVLEATPVGGMLNISRFDVIALRIMRSPAVYIAAINGPCGGGGCELSVCFDMRLVADEGAGFIQPELLIGLTTTVGGQRLVQLLGPGRALEVMLEGRMYTPQEAFEMGLVNRVIARAKLLETAQELAARYARRNRGTIAAQKRIFNEYALLAPAESLQREGAANAAGITSGPARQALRVWRDRQRELGGESVFLADLEPWRKGEVADLNADA